LKVTGKRYVGWDFQEYTRVMCSRHVQLQLFTTSVTLDFSVMFDLRSRGRHWHWQRYPDTAALRLPTAVSGNEEWNHPVATGGK